MTKASNTVELTLALVQRADRVLLGYKQTGLGAGYWNGFGGKVEAGETIVQAARRELHEEAGIVAQDCVQYGVVHVSFANETDLRISSFAAPIKVPSLTIHVFRVTEFSGVPIPTREMKPRWWQLDAIPYDRMWADDRYWLPILLAGNSFEFHCMFNTRQQLVAHHLVSSAHMVST